MLPPAWLTIPAPPLRTARQARKRMARKVMAAAASFVLVVSAGGWLWFTPVSAVSIDAAQPVELKINRFGRVVSAEGTDGLLFSGCEEAVSRLLDELPADADGELYITVIARMKRLPRRFSTARPDGRGSTATPAAAKRFPPPKRRAPPSGNYRMLLALQALEPVGDGRGGRGAQYETAAGMGSVPVGRGG